MANLHKLTTGNRKAAMPDRSNGQTFMVELELPPASTIGSCIQSTAGSASMPAVINAGRGTQIVGGGE